MSAFHAQQFAVCMAWDAFRIALCIEPKNYSKAEVLLWLAHCAKSSRSGS